MASRHGDWLKQGERDLAHARRSLEQGDYEWACFAAQQGAEKAIKAVFQKAGGAAWGHSVAALLEALPGELRPGAELLDMARELDKHYIPARYPNSHPQGAPFEYYTRGEAEGAIVRAGRIVDFGKGLLAGPAGDSPPPEGSSGDAPTESPGD